MKKAFAIVICFMIVMTTASAHPGRTDSNGGHWDHSTGEYHYHHGYPAHQHTDGICPYSFDDQTGVNSGTSDMSSVAATYTAYENERGDYGPEAESDFETKRDAHISGFESGVEYSLDSSNPDSAYSSGYNEGYEQGVSDSEYSGYDSGYEHGFQDGKDEASEEQSDEYYDYGYSDGYDDGFNDGFDDGTDSGNSQGYRDAEDKYLLIIIIGAAAAIVLFCLLIYSHRKTEDELIKSQKEYRYLQKSYNEQNKLIEEERQGWSQAVQFRDAEIQRLKAQMAHPQSVNPKIVKPQANKFQSIRPQTKRPQMPFTEKTNPKKGKSQNGSPNITHTPSFSSWKPEVHQTQAQWERFQRSKDPHMMLIGMAGNRYKVQGLSGIYDVTLNSCNCPDFLSNLHGQAPCKHIYFLARQLRIPVDAIFNDSFRNGQKPE